MVGSDRMPKPRKPLHRQRTSYGQRETAGRLTIPHRKYIALLRHGRSGATWWSYGHRLMTTDPKKAAWHQDPVKGGD